MTFRITYLLAAAVLLGPLAMQIYLPILPSLESEFGVTRQSVQLTLSLFILATGVSQLFSGTLSDRFGRRPVMLVGIAVFALGSIGCAMADSANQLIAGRIVQAMGGGTGLVIARAVLSDLYPPVEMARRLAIVIMIMLIGPMLGPLTGGYLGTLVGWRSIFWLLVGAAIAVFTLLAWRLPETHPVYKRGEAKSMRAGFALALSRPRFWLYSLITTTSTAGFYLFMSVIPHLMEDRYGEPPERLGQLFIVMAFAYGIGNFGATRFAAALGIPRTVAAGSAGTMLGLGTLVLIELTIGLVPATLFAAMAIVTMSQGFFGPSANGGAVAQVPERNGAASSLVSFSMQFFAAALIQSFAIAPTDTVWPLLTALVIVHGVCFAAAFVANRSSAASLATTGRP
ncbi:MAG: multidrug effflux MFS transporter [Pseudomonadota bacterium]